MKKILFKSITELASNLSKDYDSTVPDEIVIMFDKNSPIDLYSIGRLIAIIYFYQKSAYKFEIEINEKSKVKFKHLMTMGFDQICLAFGIRLTGSIDGEIQYKLLPTDIAFKTKSYWYCIHPLVLVNIENAYSEADAFKITNEILNNIAINIYSYLRDNLYVEPYKISYELNVIIYSIIKEIVLNIVLHSGSQYLLFGMTLNCENKPYSRTSRWGAGFEAGEDKFEILLLDIGKGIFKTINDELKTTDNDLIEKYLSVVPINNELKTVQEQENNLLKSIFHGNLVIRKGRKSEGLHEILDKVSWFNGLSTIRTGRTEVTVSGVGSKVDRFHNIVRPHVNYFTPGVIFDIVLPSQQVQNVAICSQIPKDNYLLGFQDRKYQIFRINRMPAALFGGRTTTELRRMMDLYVKEFFEQFESISNSRSDSCRFIEIDLKNSKNINEHFIDSFLQEICKGSIENNLLEIFQYFFFSNVPRKIIFNLRNRVCSTFLRLKKVFCLFIDETDQPNFIGAPRISDAIYDVEKSLKLILFNKQIKKSILLSKDNLNLGEDAVEIIENLASRNENAMFYKKEIKNDMVFCFNNIMEVLFYQRRDKLKNEITSNCIPDDESFMLKLMNGTYVRRITNYQNIWSQSNYLFTASKLLVQKMEKPATNTIIAFSYNGDKLAYYIQNILSTTRVIIVDPNNENCWGNLGIGSDFIIVIDSILYGDENSFLTKFLDFINNNYNVSPKYILTIRSNNNTFLLNRSLQVYSLFEENELNSDKFQNLTDPIYCYTCKEQGIFPICLTPIGNNSQSNYPEKVKGFKYSEIELSAEFWHNVSTLGIIQPYSTSKEKRNILFYENNEKILEYQRTRILLESNIIDFIKTKLKLKIDVIIHPNHTVGAFLANFIAQNLPKSPVILTLRQEEYGGNINISEDEYDYFIQKLNHIKETEGHNLRALIVDDSIVTGSSIFTMVGISKKLNLKLQGIFVILNRLSKPISESISALKIPFSYMYRLHLPLISSQDHPDNLIPRWNDIICSKYNNFNINIFSKTIKDKSSVPYLLWDEINIKINITKLLKIKKDNLNFTNIRSKYAHELKHIVNGLILHPDINILDFYTRLAITYNFLEYLTLEEVFWLLLKKFYEDDDKDDEKETCNIAFLRKVLFLIAFSENIKQPSCFKNYLNLINSLHKEIIESGNWEKNKHLIFDIMFSQIMINDITFIDQCCDYFSELFKIKKKENVDSIIEEIIGGLSWGIAAFKEINDHSLLESQVNKIVDFTNKYKDDAQITQLVITIFYPFLKDNIKLCQILEFYNWDLSNKLIYSIENDNSIYKYLSRAPGFSFTLKTTMAICNAEIILLFTKSKSATQYYFLDYELKSRAKPEDEIEKKILKDEMFDEEIKNMIRDGQSFYSDKRKNISELEKFYIGPHEKFKWMYGSKIANNLNEDNEYYIILGYPESKLYDSLEYHSGKVNLVKSVVFYWLIIKNNISRIISNIYKVHIISPSAMNLSISSINTIHHWKESGDNPKFLLTLALTLNGIDGFFQKAFNIQKNIAFKPKAIIDKVITIKEDLLFNLNKTKEIINIKNPNSLAWIKKVNDKSVEIITMGIDFPDEILLLWFHSTILEFIFIECLRNSLVHYKTKIEIKMSIIKNEECNSNNDHWFGFEMINDFNGGKENNKHGTGLVACKKLANAVGGSFENFIENNNEIWKIKLKLPAYEVPKKLVRLLYEYN